MPHLVACILMSYANGNFTAFRFQYGNHCAVAPEMLCGIKPVHTIAVHCSIPKMTVSARTQPYVLTPEQIQAYNEQGFILVEDFYTAEEHSSLVQFCNDLQNWGEAKGKWMQYYEKNTATGEKQLCRTENFTPYHDKLRTYVRSQRLMDVLKALHGEEYTLFKEKVNYKLPGGGGKLRFKLRKWSVKSVH
jgi:hypothetical protein